MFLRRRFRAARRILSACGPLLFPAVALSGLLAACATLDFAGIRPGIESRGRYIDGVPFVRQGEDDCGPAALVSVLSSYGGTVDMDSVRKAVYTPKLKGTLPTDMENYARSAGFGTHAGAGTTEALKTRISSGVPVICLIDFGFGPYRRPHYVTVIGYDDVNKVLVMHDGRRPNRVMREQDFESAWSRTGRWMLVIDRYQE